TPLKNGFGRRRPSPRASRSRFFRDGGGVGGVDTSGPRRRRSSTARQLAARGARKPVTDASRQGNLGTRRVAFTLRGLAVRQWPDEEVREKLDEDRPLVRRGRGQPWTFYEHVRSRVRSRAALPLRRRRAGDLERVQLRVHRSSPFVCDCHKKF